MTLKNISFHNFSIRLILVLFFLLFNHAEGAPNITSWSNDYTDNQIIMFTGNYPATIRFNISSNESISNYEWTVNKKLVDCRSNNLSWQIPTCNIKEDRSKCIWEIRVKASNSNGHAYKEWIVTTLNVSNAPVIFDSFSDGKFNGAREPDPWGRVSPTWNIIDSGTTTTVSKSLGLADDVMIGINYTGNWYGTLIFDFGTNSQTQFKIYNEIEQLMGCNFEFPTNSHWFMYDETIPVDLDNYTNIYQARQIFKNAFYDSNSGGFSYDKGWHRAYFVFRPYTNTQTNPPTNGTLIEYYSTKGNPDSTPHMSTMASSYIDHELDVKEIRINGKLFYPVSYYDNYQFYENYYFDGYNVSYDPSLDEIIVYGRNQTLQTINDLLNNNSQFVYYPANKTAYSYKTIRLDGGASLDIIDETLYMCPTSHNSIGIKLRNIYSEIFDSGMSAITITNSTILSSTSYYYSFTGRQYSHWTIDNSTISDLGTSALTESQIVITNSTIYVEQSLNLHTTEMDRYLINSVFRNNTILGSYTYCMGFGSDQFYHLSKTPLNSINPIMKDSFINSISSHGGYQNIKYNSFRIYYTGSQAKFSYYTDVLVKDLSNSPISDATVTISNMNDNHPGPKDYNGNAKTTFMTDSSGHTKLPVGNESSTIVLNGFTRTGTANWYASTRTDYNYTMNVTDSNFIYSNIATSIFSNGTIQQLTPLATATVSPNESWYRSTPNTYQNTTVIQINRLRTNITLKFPNGSITVSNATQTKLTASSVFNQSCVIFNNTIPGFANNKISFVVDGIEYANNTANSTGFISFNYSGAWSSHVFKWVITDILPPDVTPPALNSIGDRSVDTGSPLQFTISATDPDNDPLTYSATDLPTGATLDATTGVFTWTPSDGQAGTHVVTFVVSDGSLTDSEAVTITVNEIDHAPVLASIGARSVDEGSTLTFTISATDADGDSLTYSASGLPTGASLDSISGAFTWTPSDGQAGTHVVTFMVSDGSLTDSEAVTFTVNEINHAPVLASIGARSVDEENTLTFTVSATDADGDSLTFSATNLPTSASLDATTGAFTWTPSEGQAGAHVVTFMVSDGSLTDSESATITVNEDIGQPALTVIDNRLRESTPDSVLGDTTWIDAGIESNGNHRSTIWFNLSQFNSTDHIEQATLSLFWYYEERNQSTDVDIYRPANWDADYMTWNTRTAGTLWNNPGGDWYDRNNVAQGTESYAAVAFPVDTSPDHMYHDFDVTELVQSYINGTYENTGFFIKANDVNNNYIAFYSSDWSNASQRPKLSITNAPEAEPVNHAPSLNPIGDRSVNEGSPLQFTINATDPDNDPLTYSTGILPGGATFDPATRTFSWTPADGQAGLYTVHFEVTDGSLTDAEDVTITVTENPPSPSLISITPSSQITPNQPFTLTIPITPATPITGAQFDLFFNSSLATVTTVTEGNLLNQDGASTLFNSGTINNAAGTVTNVYGSIFGETTVSSQGSMATINMTAGSTTGYLDLNLTNVIISDADSSAAPYTLTNATVLIDTAPELGSIGAKSVDVEDTLAFTLSASDADGNSLTYSATNLPGGASFNTASGAFSWTPVDGQANTYVVTFEVTDGYLSDSEAVTITVNDGNHAPVITAFVPADGSVFNEVDSITIGVTATDADGQALTYNIKIDGVTKSTTSSYAWVTDYSSAGAHTIDVTVSDGIEQVTDQHTITINNIHPRWDVNEDNSANILDITIICQKIGTTVEAPYPRWDVNQDGEINVQDMSVTGYHFGETVA